MKYVFLLLMQVAKKKIACLINKECGERGAKPNGFLLWTSSCRFVLCLFKFFYVSRNRNLI